MLLKALSKLNLNSSVSRFLSAPSLSARKLLQSLPEAFSSPGWRTPCLSGSLQIRAPWSSSQSLSEPSRSKTLLDFTLLDFMLGAAAPYNPTEISFFLSQAVLCHWDCWALTSIVSDVFSSQTQHNFGSWVGITCLLHQHHVFPPPSPTPFFVCLFVLVIVCISRSIYTIKW